MSDIIHLLPDSIANQIAAGEVVQRPASVVKELVENAIDAGATQIQLRFVDAGRTLIQVIDNGKGMSPTDARMAFERHATSKIRTADDLFSLSTMGFRGEALPSIAAVSQVELITRNEDSDIGTVLKIEGSKVISQEMTASSQGCNLSVKNLFFNIPARRKFLKSNETERKNILTEWERIVLIYPEIEFILIENDVEVSKYPISSLKQRIANVMGKTIGNQLLSIEVDTTLVKISGYVGKPEFARKTRAQQFFFVNGRYMRNPYFNSAVMSAYNQLIANDEKPNYFIYMEVDPHTIDVNIHPTKTEVKFENEQPIWQILSATTKEALGKFNEIPTIDFDREDAIDIPVNTEGSFAPPKVAINTSYNPFNTNSKAERKEYTNFDWQDFYDSFQNEKTTTDIEENLKSSLESSNLLNLEQKEYPLNYQYKDKYILTWTPSGLIFIDQHRAHIRIQYEKFLKELKDRKGVSQKLLFPEILELSTSEASFIPFVIEDIEAVGFHLSHLGDNTYSINGIPSELKYTNSIEILHGILSLHFENNSVGGKDSLHQSIALSLARSTAISSNQRLTDEEISNIVNQLMTLPQNKFTPDGKLILYLMSDESIDKIFK